MEEEQATAMAPVMANELATQGSARMESASGSCGFQQMLWAVEQAAGPGANPGQEETQERLTTEGDCPL